MGSERMRLAADLGIDRLQRKRECVGQVLAAQAECRADHLDDDCNEGACAGENNRKRDKRIETLEHIGSGEEPSGKNFRRL